MDIHPAGWLPGVGAPAMDSFADRDNWLAALARDRVEAGSRALRLKPSGFAWHAERNALTLEFSLGRGAFATSVLREIAETREPLP